MFVRNENKKILLLDKESGLAIDSFGKKIYLDKNDYINNLYLPENREQMQFFYSIPFLKVSTKESPEENDPWIRNHFNCIMDPLYLAKETLLNVENKECRTIEYVICEYNEKQITLRYWDFLILPSYDKYFYIGQEVKIKKSWEKFRVSMNETYEIVDNYSQYPLILIKSKKNNKDKGIFVPNDILI